MSTISKHYRIAAFAAALTIMVAPLVAQAKVSSNPESKSKAEGADRSAAAKANSWTGTIIGINEGDTSFIITEGTALDHIKAYAQRYVRVGSSTELYKNGDEIGFANLAIGQRVTARGGYNASTRIITATRIDVGTISSAAPKVAVPASAAQVVQKAASVDAASSNKITRTLQAGSNGAEVVALQQFLISHGFLRMPAGVKLGTFGSATRQAVQKYQRSIGLPALGITGPQTRTAINKSAK